MDADALHAIDFKLGKNFIATPHGLEFEHAAQLYGLDYVRVTDRETFGEVFSRPFSVSRIIEVVTDGRTDHEQRQEIMKTINKEQNL